MTLEVLKPGVPYLGCIPNGLQDGTIVEIKGTVPYNRERFEINFLAGMDTSNSDRPLHISVRFGENVAVRNTLVRSSWQTEEREGKFPFSQGQRFLMVIIVKSHCYTINVNNQHCWDFVHRIPYYNVTALHIMGSVSIEQIRSVGNCINVNNQHCWDFVHRIPYYNVTALHIMGSVSIEQIRSVGNCINVNNQHCWDFVHRIPYYNVTALHIMGSVSIEQIRSVGNCINVNNQHCWDFVHRIPYYNVTALHIMGSVSIEQIRSVGNCGPSSLTCEPALFNHFYPAYPEPVRPELSNNFPAVYNPSIPYAYPLCRGLRPGMMIYISGQPTMNPNKFTINLQAGTSPYAPPDVAFHFDVRFFNQTIVRNTRTNNAWHDEETLSASFPFNSNCHFDMIILVTENKYMVAVNGQHFIEFRHRLWPLSRFDTLYIANDISVQSIRFA